MTKIKLCIVVIVIGCSFSAFASPLLKQWAGTGSKANYIFCEYGDGEIKKIWGNQNCPMSN